ncbi:hypothetical protein H310_13787 [Aphanomyces invadans]|uniref:Uncharacterized protein n=1 Tax=Aphanomyces invadans TaxID=157072 RepID=A0A024TCE0_9STRA|nr:hypothetical protein H310_13787 [Aphanomyces invadans]ETV91718.1 hypothetical protein H310_13787 [Aphanomyces invadans]|eukprot:XP_008879644.1 hypothetical protein H310_13787 [Aphanomyces invadans]
MPQQDCKVLPAQARENSYRIAKYSSKRTHFEWRLPPPATPWPRKVSSSSTPTSTSAQQETERQAEWTNRSNHPPLWPLPRTSNHCKIERATCFGLHEAHRRCRAIAMIKHSLHPLANFHRRPGNSPFGSPIELVETAIPTPIQCLYTKTSRYWKNPPRKLACLSVKWGGCAHSGASTFGVPKARASRSRSVFIFVVGPLEAATHASVPMRMILNRA